MSEPKKRNWMKYLLVVSLGLNLAVAGVMIGARFSDHGSHKSTKMGGFGIRGFVHSLPADKRSEVREHFRQSRSKMRSNGDAIRQSMNDIRDVISAQPFDAAALGAAFTQQRTQVRAVSVNAQKIFVKVITEMTDAERAEFVENMKQNQRRYEQKKKK